MKTEKEDSAIKQRVTINGAIQWVTGAKEQETQKNTAAPIAGVYGLM